MVSMAHVVVAAAAVDIMMRLFEFDVITLKLHLRFTAGN
jgi:hypothetical protein